MEFTIKLRKRRIAFHLLLPFHYQSFLFTLDQYSDLKRVEDGPAFEFLFSPFIEESFEHSLCLFFLPNLIFQPVIYINTYLYIYNGLSPSEFFHISICTYNYMFFCLVEHHCSSSLFDTHESWHCLSSYYYLFKINF